MGFVIFLKYQHLCLTEPSKKQSHLTPPVGGLDEIAF